MARAQGGQVGPPAVVRALIRPVPPDPLHTGAFRAGDRQPERPDALLVRHPPPAGDVALVIAHVVQHHKHRPRRPGRRHLNAEGHNGGRILRRRGLLDHSS